MGITTGAASRQSRSSWTRSRRESPLTPAKAMRDCLASNPTTTAITKKPSDVTHIICGGPRYGCELPGGPTGRDHQIAGLDLPACSMHVYPLPKAEPLQIHSAADSGRNAPRPNREATLASGRFRCQYAVARSRHSSSTSSLRDTQHTVCAPSIWLRQACPGVCGARLRDQATECIFVRCLRCTGRCCVVVCDPAIRWFP